MITCWSMWISLVQCRWHDKLSEVAADAKSVESAVDPAGAKVCWCGMCGAETSRQKSVDVEQFVQRLEKQFLKMDQERASPLIELWVRNERSEQVEKEREVLEISSSGKLVVSQTCSHRRTSTCCVSFSIRSIVACVYKHEQIRRKHAVWILSV